MFTWDLSDRSVPELPCHLLSQRARRCHAATAQTSAYFTLVPCIHPRITVSPTPRWFTLSSEMFMYICISIYDQLVYLNNYIHHAAVSNFYMALIKKGHWWSLRIILPFQESPFINYHRAPPNKMENKNKFLPTTIMINHRFCLVLVY